MKRFAALFLLLALASSAHAAGIALRWGMCDGTSNRNFACDKPTGSEVLVGSFDPPSGVSQLNGFEAILSIAAADGNLPSWWQMFDAGSCRRSSISTSFDMSDQTNCDDAWSGVATGGMGAAPVNLISRYNIGNPNGVDIWIVGAVPEGQIQGVSSGRRYATFKLIINHQKSTGAAACGGCDTPVCITLDAIRLTQPGPDTHTPGTNVDMTDGIASMGGQSQIATWQGGTANCGAGFSKASTWSELKSRFKSH